MMTQVKFGDRHTVKKLEVLQKYLSAYTTALKNQKFSTVYFDAFAGTGSIPQDVSINDLIQSDDLLTFVTGSARRALDLTTSFSHYVFIERSAQKVEELKGLAAEFPKLAATMSFQCGDANAQLEKFCAESDWRKSRAVVFLDPFGNQVTWQTIERIAATKAIDLWYLFPAGLGVHRQISRDGSVHQSHEASLDSLLGTADWRGAFVRKDLTTDLFGSAERTEKTATPGSITEFMIERMKVPFGGRVLPNWLKLGSRGVHMYSLLFASANPSERAWSLASKLASAVMK